jgi:hypothetical protein
MTLRDLDRSYKDSALNILCAAFHDYPVMRYVIGEADPEYDGKLRQLIGFSVEARLRNCQQARAARATGGAVCQVRNQVQEHNHDLQRRGEFFSRQLTGSADRQLKLRRPCRAGGHRARCTRGA